MTKTNSPLKDLNLVSFESRQKDAMAQLIQKQGGNCISAPSMQEIPLEKNKDVFHFAEKLFEGQIDVLVFLTGVGARTLIQIMEKEYGLEKTLKALSIPIVVTRGPKPVRVLNEHKIPISLRVSEPNTWRQIVQEIDEFKEVGSLEGKVIAIQEYGVSNEDLVDCFKRRGACVIQVPIYRWALPEDIEPMKKAIHMIIDGSIDVTLFTSGNQVNNVMRVANEEGFSDALKDSLNKKVVASIGPICSESLSKHGVDIDLEPEHSTMGAFILEISKQAKDILDSKENKKSISITDTKEQPKEDGGVDLEVLNSSLFMRALRREPTERVPIWLMRQAGRYMKEYQAIRKKMPFLDFCKNPDLVTEITVKAQEILDVDAAIIFSDILVLVECFGLDLEYSRSEGPVIKITLTEGKKIDEVQSENIDEKLNFVYEAIKQTRRSLKKDIPLLGFGGAPFTLASYMIEGGASRTFNRTKAFMYSDKGRWESLMNKISDGLIQYLNGQIDAGVQAIQLFDSWVGCLGPHDYKEYVFDFTKKVFDGIKGRVPVIHFGTGIDSFLESFSETGADCIGLDYRVELETAWKRLGYTKSIQGNLDPLVLYSSKDFIKDRVTRILNQTKGRPGHIFNLGHGVLPETPVENAKYLVQIVGEISSKS